MIKTLGIFLCIGVIGATSVAQETVRMRFEPPVGTVMEVSVVSAINMEMSGMMDQRIESETTMLMEVAVREQDEQGWVMTTTIKSVEMELPGIDAGAEELPEFFKNMVGTEIQYRMDAHGKSSLLPVSDNSDELEALMTFFSTDDFIGNPIAVGAYAKDQVQVGDVWVADSTSGTRMGGIQINNIIKTEYTVVGFVEHQGRLIPEMEVNIQLSQETDELDLEASGTGRIVFDPVLGLLVESNTTMNMKYETKMELMGVEQAIAQSVETFTRTTGKVVQPGSVLPESE